MYRKFTKDKLIELLKIYANNMFILDTMLNDISDTTIKDVDIWLDGLNNDIAKFRESNKLNENYDNLTELDIQNGYKQQKLFKKENKDENNIG